MPSKSEKKNYEVLVTAYATVLVIAAESPEKALEYANDEISTGDFQIDEASVKREVPDDALESARRNADTVAEDPDAEDDEGDE